MALSNRQQAFASKITGVWGPNRKLLITGVLEKWPQRLLMYKYENQQKRQQLEDDGSPGKKQKPDQPSESPPPNGRSPSSQTMDTTSCGQLLRDGQVEGAPYYLASVESQYGLPVAETNTIDVPNASSATLHDLNRVYDWQSLMNSGKPTGQWENHTVNGWKRKAVTGFRLNGDPTRPMASTKFAEPARSPTSPDEGFEIEMLVEPATSPISSSDGSEREIVGLKEGDDEQEEISVANMLLHKLVLHDFEGQTILSQGMGESKDDCSVKYKLSMIGGKNHESLPYVGGKYTMDAEVKFTNFSNYLYFFNVLKNGESIKTSDVSVNIDMKPKHPIDLLAVSIRYGLVDEDQTAYRTLYIDGDVEGDNQWKQFLSSISPLRNDIKVSVAINDGMRLVGTAVGEIYQFIDTMADMPVEVTIQGLFDIPKDTADCKPVGENGEQQCSKTIILRLLHIRENREDGNINGGVSMCAMRTLTNNSQKWSHDTKGGEAVDHPPVGVVEQDPVEKSYLVKNDDVEIFKDKSPTDCTLVIQKPKSFSIRTHTRKQDNNLQRRARTWFINVNNLTLIVLVRSLQSTIFQNDKIYIEVKELDKALKDSNKGELWKFDHLLFWTDSPERRGKARQGTYVRIEVFVF
eukprot:GHVS01070576.1.p1 GENE.GHVS01070576.1~~GHVS01070576.1.p1  ORF type:complete len:643 (-),score=54.14 GHVS01070576.1:15-1913(-)